MKQIGQLTKQELTEYNSGNKDVIKKYLKEEKEEHPIDTDIFYKWALEYNKEQEKINDILIENVKKFIKENNKNIKNRDVKQWIKDDIGEYFSGSVPNNILKNLLDLVK